MHEQYRGCSSVKGKRRSCDVNEGTRCCKMFIEESSPHPSTEIYSAELQENKCEDMPESLEALKSSSPETYTSYHLSDELPGVHVEFLPIKDDNVLVRETNSSDTMKSQLIKRLAKHCYVNPQDIASVRTEVEDVMIKTCDNLARKHPFFLDCKPILRGSMREETKISAPDEIDFMICISDARDYVTIDLEKVPGVLSKKPTAKDLTSARISELIRETLEENLPNLWCLPPVNAVYHSIHNSLARSYLVRRPNCKPVEDISVDITLVTKLEDGYVVLSRDWKHCLQTFPEHEIQLTSKLGRESEFIPCLKYAKYLAEHFFGHYEIRGMGYSVNKSYLSSFALKTILFYMLEDPNGHDIEAYSPTSSHREEEQFDILYGLFKRLATALHNYELPNYFCGDYDIFKMSNSFKPKTVLDKCERLLEFLESIERGEKNSLSMLYESLDTCEPRHFTQHGKQYLPRTRSGTKNAWSS